MLSTYLSELESSPFFTASWEPRFLKKLLAIFTSCMVAFLLISALFVKTYVTFPFSYNNGELSVTLKKLTTLSYPMYAVIKPGTEQNLILSNLDDEVDRIIFPKKYGLKTSRTSYRVSKINPNIKLIIRSDASKFSGYISVINPTIRMVDIYVKTMCFIISLLTVVLCFKAEVLKPFIIIYLLVCFYNFLDIFSYLFSTIISTSISMLFFFAFISLSFMQVKILSSNIPSVFTITFGVCAVCSISVVLIEWNSVFFIPSFICLLILISVATYLFSIGTSIISSFLLSVHFGWMWAIGLSVYITTVANCLTGDYQTSFFASIVSPVMVTVFIIFQATYLIGEPTKAKIPEAPLDQASRLNRIDHLIETLSKKKDDDAYATTFQ